MDLAQQYPARHPLEIEDLVAKFVEEKLGRHDWASNWPVWKAKNAKYMDTIRAWFHQNGEDVDPRQIAAKIEDMIVSRPGRWR